MNIADSFVQRRAIHGDIWKMDGVKCISTNLGGVHGRGLAKQAKDKGLINSSNRDFNSSPLHGAVKCIAVKGKAPETARIPGRMFSESTTGANLDLLAHELELLRACAQQHRETNFFLPFIGLGFGEGNANEILPLLFDIQQEPNIWLVSRTQDVVAKYPESFKPGVRRDATSR